MKASENIKNLNNLKSMLLYSFVFLCLFGYVSASGTKNKTRKYDICEFFCLDFVWNQCKNLLFRKR